MGGGCKDPIQERLEQAMPWIGGYIAAASAICTLAMAADVFNGFRHKKLWFPCKYFSLNATSLTLLGVAMKLPMDLTTVMIYAEADARAKYCSTMFMSTAMANFMSSLGSMNDKNILPNVVALGILVITIIVDVQIQMFLSNKRLFSTSTISMLLLLVTLVSLAITVPTTKRNLESKYQEKRIAALREDEVLNRREAFRIDDQRGCMIKYLAMAETSSPQFVVARSVVCTTSAMICLILLPAGVMCVMWTNEIGRSPYGVTTSWILYVQSTGIVVGTIAPVSRWLLLVSFKCSTINRNSFIKVIKIETYWIQTLVDMRDSFSAPYIRQDKYRKFVHDAKWLAITFCIGFQILIVLLNKLFFFLSALLLSPFFLCFTYIKKFGKQNIGHEAGGDTDLILSRYVLLLEGEAELPRRLVKSICRQADHMIETGRKKQPQSLVNLLHKFVNFNGVGQFDNSKIPSLHSQEPPNCWTLPVVTLTSIAVALPNIAEHESKQLLSSVSEGLNLAELVEKTLNKNTQLLNIRKAADICWVQVVLYMKWLDIDLRRRSRKCKNSKEVLQDLSNKVEGFILEFKKEEQDPIMQNPLHWPAKVVAANSMYRISRTILLSCDEEESEHTDGLFERLSVMIADILAACLTNLPHVITTMCHRDAIEKREKSVRKAFRLLGETEQVVEFLQQQEWPSLDHDKAASIIEWRALFQQDRDDPAASVSSAEIVTSTPVSSEEHLAITVDC